MKICQHIPNFVKVTQKYRVPCLKTQVLFVVAAVLNHHRTLSLGDVVLGCSDSSGGINIT